MKHNKFTYIFLINILLMSFCAISLNAQVKELEIYNEWFCDDSNLNPERPFFVIRDTLDFHQFWNKTNFKGAPPHINFEKYMIFVWAPKPTNKDCSQVQIEKLLYKDGCILVMMNFISFDKYTIGSHKRPVKATIFPYIKSGDIFVYKKIKKGWKEYEWQPYYAVWDMDNERKRPFEYVYVDKENRPLYQLATTTGNVSIAIAQPEPRIEETVKKKEVKPVVLVEQESRIYTPKQSQVSMPRELPEAKSLSVNTSSVSQTSNTTSVQTNQPGFSNQKQQTTAANLKDNKSSGVKTTSAPISIGNTPAPKVSEESKPEVAPGMGEDPLFGSEFDITF